MTNGKRIILPAAMLAATLLVFSSNAICQRTTANLYGTIKDASGAVIPGAAVGLTSEQTNQVIMATSDETGEFTASFIPVGRYTIKVEAKGFKTFVQKGLELTASQQARFPVTLEVGGLNEVTTVTAEATLLQNASATLNDNISRTALTELPLSRRDFSGLLSLQNGVRFDTQGMFSINGLATAGISITVDGMDAAGDPETKSIASFQGYNQINVMSLEAIQEVTVSKGVASAEIGSTYSGNFNVISRRGTNKFHGSLFENWQNDYLNARNVFVTTRPVVRFNQFGGSAGGPIFKDKLFFFFTYEGYRQSNMAIVSGLVPTPMLKQQAIAALPAYKAALDFWPDPTETYAANALTANYRGTRSNKAHDNHTVSRLDYQLNNTNMLAARWTRGRPFQENPALYSNPRDYIGMQDSGVLTWTRSAASWTSEARFGVNNSDTNRLDILYSSQVTALQLQGQFNMDAELLTLAGHTYTVEEIVAKSFGKHTIKFGGIYGAQTPGRFDEQVPNFRYANLADLLANRPNQVTFTFGVPRYYGRTWNIGVFFQDDFRVTPNLILNLGVRYEYYSVFKEKTGNLWNPGNPYNAVKVPPVYRPADSMFNADKNNIMPRVGLAWSLGKQAKTVIRSGFGIAVAAQSLRNFSGYEYTGQNIPTRFTFTGSEITTLNLKFPMLNPQGLAAFAGRLIPLGPGVYDENNPNPCSMQWSLTIQRQLTPTMVFETGYSGSKGLKVTMTHNWNLPDRNTNVRPFPGTLQFSYNDASDMSWYHGWQSTLRKRLSRDFSLDLNYTWSRAMAVSRGDFWNGNNLRAQDENNLRAEHGPTNLDRPHELRMSALYILPFARLLNAGGLVKEIAGGWQLSGILRAQSGSVLNVTQSNSRELQRPDSTGTDPYLHPSTINGLYINKAAYAAVPLGATGGQTIRPGSVSKNSLRGPNFWTLDMSLAKSLRITEGTSLQLRVDMFNATNHVNWGNPNTDINNANFARILSAGAARSMQLALRLAF